MKVVKVRVDVVLELLIIQEVNFFYKNKDIIDLFILCVSMIVGVVLDVVGKYFEKIENVLIRI